MSNSIWRKASEKPDIDKQILIINDFGYVIYFGKCAVAPGNKWVYIDDLIAQADKAERLQKAVDYALQVLKNVDEIGGIDLEIIKIKQLIKENQ